MSISVTPKQKETVTTDVFSCLFLDSKASFILPQKSYLKNMFNTQTAFTIALSAPVSTS